MITLKEIAQICNVSPSTVSNILNGKPKVSAETRERILKVISETGYQPNYFAQGMRKQKTSIIGILAEDLDQFSSPGVIEGIMSYCEQRNYRTILENMRLYERWGGSWFNQEEKYNTILKPALSQMLSIKVDGIIYVAGHERVINCFPEDFELPGVVAYGFSGNKGFPSVVINDEKAAYDAVTCLIRNGHRRIGLITGAADNIHTQKRLAGYKKALNDNHIAFSEQLVQTGDWQRKSGYTAAGALLTEKVTAFFCMNDIMAAGVYDCLYDRGLYPGKDIAVMGFDNREIAEYFKPGLSTMEIQLKAIGEKAAAVMLDMLDTGKKYRTDANKKEISVACRFIKRESVNQITQENCDRNGD